jgi:nucleotide-binding universal stress UspA family protein
MKAIVGIDGSAGSWQALREVQRWFSPEDEVLLFYAPPDIKLAPASRHIEDLAERARRRLAQAVLEEGRGRLPPSLQNRVRTIVGGTEPRRELLQAAEEHQADLIVVGARGLGPIRGLLLGSVSLWIARHSTRPVLVARRKQDKLSEVGVKILMPIDETPASPSTLSLLSRLHWPPQSSGRLMHVVEPIFGGEAPSWLFERAEYANDQELARAYLEQFETLKRSKFDELSQYARSLPQAFHHQPPVVLGGYPAERILETAEADDIDLIVLGLKRVSGFARLMLGSTAERVLTHAPCSVLLVPHG